MRCVLFLFLYCNLSFSQTRKGDISFVKFIRRLSTIHEIGNIKKGNGVKIIERKSFDKKNYSFTSIEYQHKDFPKKFTAGGAIFVKDSIGNPIMLSTTFCFTDYTNCDSILLSLQSEGIPVDTFYHPPYGPCSFKFCVIDSNEIKCINSIESSLHKVLIDDYVNISPFDKIFDSSYHFTEESQGYYLGFLKSIYKEAMFNSAINLIKTKNIPFNWFVAEFLNFADKEHHFLSQIDIDEVIGYNGHNGYCKFREDKLLFELYTK